MQYGATFSHRHFKWLGIDPSIGLNAYTSLGLTWIRLGCYWDEIERTEGVFQFKELDTLISYCKQHNLNIILTVGMKAPRWPEYYLPKWLVKQVTHKRNAVIDLNNSLFHKYALRFINECIKKYQNNNAIKVWQVENEPLDPSGEQNWRISREFLESEINLVRESDSHRKILINLWGNELNKRKYYQDVTELADIVGLDLYMRVPNRRFNGKEKYRGPMDSVSTIRQMISEIRFKGKDVWLSELQTEPWGDVSSFLPEHVSENIAYGNSLNPTVMLLWGYEWWYQQKQKGNSSYWERIGKALNPQTKI